jgi:hypothetical protein
VRRARSTPRCLVRNRTSSKSPGVSPAPSGSLSDRRTRRACQLVLKPGSARQSRRSKCFALIVRRADRTTQVLTSTNPAKAEGNARFHTRKRSMLTRTDCSKMRFTGKRAVQSKLSR